jgi:hypothetical protein
VTGTGVVVGSAVPDPAAALPAARVTVAPLVVDPVACVGRAVVLVAGSTTLAAVVGRAVAGACVTCGVSGVRAIVV